MALAFGFVAMLSSLALQLLNFQVTVGMSEVLGGCYKNLIDTGSVDKRPGNGADRDLCAQRRT